MCVDKLDHYRWIADCWIWWAKGHLYNSIPLNLHYSIKKKTMEFQWKNKLAKSERRHYEVI